MDQNINKENPLDALVMNQQEQYSSLHTNPQNYRTIEEFKNYLRHELESNLTLEHPIFSELSHPQSIELLRLMVLQGYQLTKMFARYVAMLYYNCPVSKEFELDRMKLAANLYEEETGKLSKTAGHLQLMQRFAFSIGLTEKELESTTPVPETQELINYRLELVSNPQTFHMGAAAIMIASEGQNLEKKNGKDRHQLLPDGLKLSDHDLAFFTVHAAEDVHHVRDGIEIVAKLCQNRKMQEEAVQAIHQTCARFWRFYDGIQRVYKLDRTHLPI